MEKFDVVIIGAGISGMSLAHHCLGMGLKTAVIEREGRVGGAIHTERLDAGFWLELGAHTCYNSYGGLLDIIEYRGMLGQLRKRERVPWVFWQDGVRQSALSRVNLVELAISLPRLITAKKAGASLAEYYGKILGWGNFKRVAGPMMNAVVSQEAGGFPAGMLFRKRLRRKEIFRSYTLEGGLQSVAEAVAGHDGLTVRKGHAAAAVRFDNGKYDVRLENGDRLEGSALALATPPDAAAGLLSDGFGEVATLLSGIAVRQVASLGMVVKKERVSWPPCAGIVGVNDLFHSVVSRDTIAHPSYRGFVFHFKPETDTAARWNRIGEMLGIDQGQVEHMVSKTNRLPAPALGHEALIADIDRKLEGRKLLLTGNYFTGMAIEECVERSAREAARLQTML